MSDLPSSLGIEAVELVSHGGATVTVRVTGRWRRRRPELRGQAMLVVEAVGGRQRFLAMPEPPSLTGAAPGTWRMSFAVPAELASELPGRTFLQLGSVMVPLPVGSATEAADAPERPSLDVLEARRVRSSELAAESARRRAAEAEAAVAEHTARVDELERELEEARGRSDALKAEIAERERRLRGSEQHVYAERALRAELEQQLIEQTRAAERDSGALHGRVRELERELDRMRRAVDEAQHLANAARAARASAERRLAERAEPPPALAVSPTPAVTPPPPVATPSPLPAASPPPPPLAVDRARVRAFAVELALARATTTSPVAGPRRAPRALDGDRAALVLESVMAEGRAGRGAAERRIAEQLAAEHLAAEQRATELERELAEARLELADQRRLSERAYAAIELVRAELERLRNAPPPDPPDPPNPPGPPAGPVQPERLSAALARLRETTPPPAPAEEGTPPEAATPPPAPEVAAPRAEVTPPPPPEVATPPAEVTPPPPPEAAAPPAEVTPPPEIVPPEPPEAATPPTPPPADTPTPEPVVPARPAKPWLRPVFGTLTARDPAAAGRLVLALLPAQRAADPHPVAYDLVLGDLATARVTVWSGAMRVELGDTPRPMAEIDFQLTGDLASIARLLVAGRVRRLVARRLHMGRKLARVKGDRHRLAALEQLVDAPLTLKQLHAAGVTPDPVLALTLAELMIEPEWTAGERFTIGYREPPAPSPSAYFHIRDGKPPMVTEEPPHGPVAAVIVRPADELLAVLAGEFGEDVAIEGDPAPLALVSQWLDRAQCG
jgi:hypothetical protein